MNVIMDKVDEVNFKQVSKIAGAFIAWIIGAGFATGREILSFFSSFGYYSYGVIAIILVGFALIGMVIMEAGYQHRNNPDFRQYEYFCGKKIGRLYSIIMPIMLFFMMGVLISATGSTIHEYYGLNRYAASSAMAIIVLLAYLAGFDRFIQVLSKIGPLLVLFFLLVGTIVIFKDYKNFSSIGLYRDSLIPYQAAPVWFFSGFLYFSLAISSGGTYFAKLGASCKNIKVAKYGAWLGAFEVSLAVLILSSAILLNIDAIRHVDVPTLYLAKRVSPLMSSVFTLILLLGMFSSSSATMWSLCRFVYPENKRRNRMASICIAFAATLIGVLPFAKLVAIILPAIGYIGIYYILCVIYKGIAKSIKSK
nr:hypothetical protein [uncultured Peptostreptococcus sp.]